MNVIPDGLGQNRETNGAAGLATADDKEMTAWKHRNDNLECKLDYPRITISMREPNFFIVGAPKAGTTSLYHYLDQHPDVYMSPMKETMLFFRVSIRSEHFEPSFRKQGHTAGGGQPRQYVRGPMDKKLSGGIVRVTGPTICDYFRQQQPNARSEKRA